jgi:hypothetical protein
MSTDKLRLLLTALEAEVVEEALDLYVQVRPVAMDGRFEYRYRAARSVLESLRQGECELGTLPRGDDEDSHLGDDDRPAHRPVGEQLED